MELPSIDNVDFSGKRVLLRADLDVPIKNGEIEDNARLTALVPSIEKIRQGGASKIIILGKLGRPKGTPTEEYKLRPVWDYYNRKFSMELGYAEYKPFKQFAEIVDEVNETENEIVLLENTRFWVEEAAGDAVFAELISQMGDIYVNDSFGVSHRKDATIIELPKLLPHYAGIQMVAEVFNLSKILNNPKMPVVTLLSGAKEDKLEYLEDFIRISDRVLIGGLLPTLLGEDYSNEKVEVGKLIQDKEDITKNTIDIFVRIIEDAGTVVVSGPMGRFEDPGHRQGTKEVLEAVAHSKAFKVAGGGDTGNALKLLGLQDKFDWVSMGGGAMLTFLTKGTLPGIEALLN